MDELVKIATRIRQEKNSEDYEIHITKNLYEKALEESFVSFNEKPTRFMNIPLVVEEDVFSGIYVDSKKDFMK